ncbi:unnamed protein product [Spirodela intermedia]|uniref:Rhamnogalacturonase A/B/Epimerase-like pectate lyase domain-containing protein n=1 Tax=Spirodela intermedia TaxID=51605 RepID=A0ABN7EBH2_SPIIN|nr:unnamed protein product [Spirodela intermedia]
MDAQKLLLLLALVLLFRPGDSQHEQTFSGDPSFRTGLDITDSSGVRKLASTVRNVKDFGARGDGSSDDTKAFAAAWKAACSSSAPVTVLVPEGKAYRLKPITFSGPCKSPITVAYREPWSQRCGTHRFRRLGSTRRGWRDTPTESGSRPGR